MTNPTPSIIELVDLFESFIYGKQWVERSFPNNWEAGKINITGFECAAKSFILKVEKRAYKDGYNQRKKEELTFGWIPTGRPNETS